MPTYEYRCKKCRNIQEEVHSIKDDPEIVCERCGDKPMERLISNNPGGFIMKQDTPEKLWKEKRHQRKKNAELGVKQIERYGTSGGVKLVPNVDGQTVESWSDAKKLAKDKGKDSNSYDRLVESEKHVSKISGINDKKYKEAKENKNKY